MPDAPETNSTTPLYTDEDHGERIDEFLDTVLEAAKLELDYTVGQPTQYDPDFDRPDLMVDFFGEDVDLLMANKGELLLALEHLTLEMLRIPSEHHARIAFDCNGRRLLRMRELRMTAQAAADKVVDTNQPFAFNPLNSRERRVLHIALRDRTDVRSESASSQYGRYVVIYPASMQTPEVAPPPPGPFAPRGGRPEGSAGSGPRGEGGRPPRRDGGGRDGGGRDGGGRDGGRDGGRGGRPPRRGPRR
ncbi:MAG: hypothetical protein MUF01_11025 [Bryobacterales bacterium]|jgi:spoIIIJ-associated protein|nr:hypothetical protein [Bryobacterales bacterium]